MCLCRVFFLYKGQYRTATVVAETALDCLLLSQENFHALGLKNKIIFPRREAVNEVCWTDEDASVAPSVFVPACVHALAHVHDA